MRFKAHTIIVYDRVRWQRLKAKSGSTWKILALFFKHLIATCDRAVITKITADIAPRNGLSLPSAQSFFVPANSRQNRNTILTSGQDWYSPIQIQEVIRNQGWEKLLPLRSKFSHGINKQKTSKSDENKSFNCTVESRIKYAINIHTYRILSRRRIIHTKLITFYKNNKIFV